MENRDWSNFPVTDIPKEEDTTQEVNQSVHPDTSVDDGATEDYIGRNKVFPEGHPTGNSIGRGTGGIYGAQQMKIRPLTISKTVDVLNLHGVVDASEIQEVVHPKDQTLLDSITKQEAFLVTKDLKIIDVAAHEWPIDIRQASDVRSVPKSVVRYKDEIGVVAERIGDLIVIKGRSTMTVPMDDTDPVMLEDK